MSDTGTKNNSCNLVLWQYQEEYRDVVTKALEERFGIPCDNGFPNQLEDIAAKLAKDYWCCCSLGLSQTYSHTLSQI